MGLTGQQHEGSVNSHARPSETPRPIKAIGRHRDDAASAKEQFMDPSTPMLLAGASYASRDDAVAAFKVVRGAWHQDELVPLRPGGEWL
jgi:hypothetical protein